MRVHSFAQLCGPRELLKRALPALLGLVMRARGASAFTLARPKARIKKKERKKKIIKIYRTARRARTSESPISLSAREKEIKWNA